MMKMWWQRFFATGSLAALVACAPSQASVGRPAVVPDAIAPTASGTKTQVDPPPSAAAMAEARHLLNRCAFGPRPGEVERVARLGSQRWLDQQLSSPDESPLLEPALFPYRAAFAAPAELVSDWLGEGWEDEGHSLRQLRRELKPYYKDHMRRLAAAELTRDILSQRQLEAVMTNFWANHFNVFASKGFVRIFGGDYLERAIRPHALGTFSDLLLATARHPAMLLYLDNAQSRREKPGASPRRRGGLNENYARELLELHTLGADAGYSQSDVQEVARVLTGWSVEELRGGRLRYVYRRSTHDSGEKQILGEAFPAGGQEEEGIRLLQLLSRHPATAKHLARRLCARLVADVPPPSCVDAATRAYLASDGDIKQVLRAILTDAAFWSPAARGSKLKTPLELLASTARAFDARPDGTLDLAITLDELGEPLLQERAPTGYPDSEPEWASGGGMLARLRFASDLGQGKLSGLRLSWSEMLPSGPADASSLVARLGEQLLALPPDSHTLAVVRGELAGIADADQRRAVAVALLVGSPEFQRQ
ncbi:MAG TPA: DUF1800 domain-containing protein [Polyangiaceae bacterium]